jgi:hypothetical protein
MRIAACNFRKFTVKIFINSDDHKSTEDVLFDQIISSLQEIVIDPYFEKMLT